MPDVKIIADLREHEQSRVAILEDGRLAEVFIDYSFEDDERGAKVSRLSRQGDIFKARVDKILPAINAAFVALTSHGRKNGEGRNAFMYIADTDEVKPGQNIIVQVTKNARQNKAPRVSMRVSVPGRWLVLVPESSELGVSHRIADNAERKRLRAIAEQLKASAPGFGVVIRTAAEGVSEELLRADMASLLELWKDIRHKAKHIPSPCLLYRDTGTLGKVLRDEIAGGIDEIIVDDPDEFERAKAFVERFFPEKPNLQLYTGTTPIFEYFGIEKEIAEALERKVWLRSGAYLVIDQTEALTVVDVNTGKFTSAPDMRHTVLATNLEAADEIARQLRLRAVGGIVVVDFIDMEEEEDRRELLKHFGECVSRDRLKARVFSITQLGLVELTRKRERSDLRTLLTRNCPVCGGCGYVEREENIALRIKRFVRKITGANNSEAFLLQVSVHMASYLSKVRSEWEEEFGRKIFLAGMEDFPTDKFRLEYQRSLSEAEARAKELGNKGEAD
ncbi:MAG: Rne/Rng family ribonuclease [Synergistaceae bacterium]|nr:Rne/Rng family ribonuclease [Synergistaceae bacterium]